MLDVALLGFFGGFFTVPLYTWLQLSSPDSFRSQAIAANNIINGFYMVAAALASVVVLQKFGSIAYLLLGTAILNILATLHLLWQAPVIWQQRSSWLKARSTNKHKKGWHHQVAPAPRAFGGVKARNRRKREVRQQHGCCRRLKPVLIRPVSAGTECQSVLAIVLFRSNFVQLITISVLI
jgi:MFS family permease